MEVLLKKTKITNSIVKQCQSATSEDIRDFEVLGWCHFIAGKSIVKYILLYGDDTLKKFHMFRSLEKSHNSQYTSRQGEITPAKYEVIIDRKNFVPTYYSFSAEKTRDEFYDKLNEVQETALTKGQIFL